jgi:hypothetical protein
VGTDASTTVLRRQYASLDRRLQLVWWWGRTKRLLQAVGKAALFAAALVFAVLTCSRVYGQIIHGLGSLHRM